MMCLRDTFNPQSIVKCILERFKGLFYSDIILFYHSGLETSFKTGDINEAVEMDLFSPIQFMSKSPSSCAATGNNTHANH